MKCHTWRRVALTGIAAIVLAVSGLGQGIETNGRVVDSSRAAITGATVTVRTLAGTQLAEASTGPDGSFSFTGLPQGSHVLRTDAKGFRTQESKLVVGQAGSSPLVVEMEVEANTTSVTVTSTLGRAEDVDEAPQVITTRDRGYMLQRPMPTIGNSFENSPGIMVQQTTYGQVSPVMRGLTGFETLLLMDGIRYNTSIFRSGPNQYLAFVDPSQAQGIEAVMGPASAPYGSDSLGGTINVRSMTPTFGSSKGLEFHGEAGIAAATADASAGANFLGSLGNQRTNWMFGGYGRKLNDLRGGRGYDSHHSFTRFLGLGFDQVRDLYDGRMQDTGFSQFGFDNKVSLRLTPSQSLTLRQLYSDQQNVRSYRDQLGGVGRLLALVEPQRLNFGYARYEKLRLGFLDSFSGTFSVNSMVDGYRRQNLRPTDTIQRDDARVDTLGFGVQGVTHWGSRQAIVFGGDSYQEKIFATRFTTNPVSGAVTQDRALYPNGTRYSTSGAFVQDTIELIPRKLRAVLGGRLTWIGFETNAADNITPGGRPLGVTDSTQNYAFFSFNTSLVYNLTEHWSVNGLVGRGIRAPNTNDLGSIGLTTLGFDVTSIDAAAANALVGTDGSEAAVSSGLSYGKLKAESLNSYEVGLRFDSRKFFGRVQAYDSEIHDPLVGRTLVFPAGNVPASIAGYAVTPLPQSAAQQRSGVVTVATSLAPRAVRSSTNIGRIRYYGIESVWRYRFTSQWSLEGNYSILNGRELDPNRPIRRLPPQQLYSGLRYTPTRRLWLELTSTFSGSQYRMNGADYDDDRMGASRRRTDIRDFFRGGFASPYVTAGPNGVLGDADDLLRLTNETLLQVQNRILPIGQVVNGVLVVNDSTRVPLYLGTSSFWTFGIRGGVSLTERVSMNFALMNLADRNYRIHGSGTDSPGINASVGFRYAF